MFSMTKFSYIASHRLTFDAHGRVTLGNLPVLFPQLFSQNCGPRAQLLLLLSFPSHIHLSQFKLASDFTMRAPFLAMILAAVYYAGQVSGLN